MSAIAVTCALIERDGKLLLARRPEGKSLAGKWEFPGGKVHPGESSEACLQREIEEELGCRIEVGPALSPVLHSYPGGTIELIPFRCTVLSGEPEALEHAEIRWIDPLCLREMDLAGADEPIAEEYLGILGLPSGAP
ncbi:MAG: 8-oxo-dGTP diphosphatase [Verrucomicrobia bacterium]|jgi:8-oxo-dGTP diphosphatase|nr:MAG: 8-oxo-dGTP diphosphatase [Verrucomicrobiota bacterium]